MKLQAILKILMENQVNPRSTVKDIDVDVERQITEELGINAELDEVFLFDETLKQSKAVIHYQLFGQKFQILIQYCGHIAKIYFNNIVKCIKCYIQDEKAWAVLIMKHDFGDINETKVDDVLNIDQIFTLEHSDNLEDKKIRDNDIIFDGYVCPKKVEILFAVEMEQVSLFKERPQTGKSKRETKHQSTINIEVENSFDIWEIPPHGSVLSGILDSEQKCKVINLIQSWHQAITRDSQREQIEEQEEIQIETNTKGKKTKKKGKVEYGEVEAKDHLEIIVNGTNFFSESTTSAWFHTSSLHGHYFGLLLKSKDPLPPEVTTKLKPMSLKLGNLSNLPIEVLDKYDVRRIHAVIEFEHPLTNIQTIPKPTSKNMELNFFQMTPFTTIKDQQRFFAAFYLKHMIIQIIGEIQKKAKPKVEKEDIHENIDSHNVKNNKMKNLKNKKKSLTVKEEKNTEDIASILVPEETHTNLNDFPKDVKEMEIPKEIILSENENVVLIRICLFRIDLNSLVKFNHFHRIKEILSPSAIYDKEPINGASLESLKFEGQETEEVKYASLEVNLSQNRSDNLKTYSNSEVNTVKMSRELSKYRGYLIGIDYKQNLTLEFEFYIQPCFKNLCKKLFKAGDTGLNNIFVLFEDTTIMAGLVKDIHKYNTEILAKKSGSVQNKTSKNPPSSISQAITGFALEFSDIGFVFTETTIRSSFPLLLQWVLNIRDSIKKIIYNTRLIIPDRIYSELLQQNGMFTYKTQRTFKNALRRKKAPQEVYVNLCELLHVRSIEDIHKYQLLPDVKELNSLIVSNK
ncbi:hypothetical protein M8J77_019555 [Diaphorina citri]|nr:hypothetical protein M8J77_019555 [Diaphorina citri]